MSDAFEAFAARGARRDLAAKSARGVAWSATGRVATQLLRLLSLMALARLLGPEEFGLVAIILAVVGVAGIFQDFGFSAATVRAEHLRAEQVSTLFWLNAGAGAAATAAVLALAPALAEFYDDPRVTAATLALAPAFALNGLTSQHRALLTRAMRFDVLARVNVATTAATAAVSLAAAWGGAGYWALIAGALAGDLAGLALCWAACPWRPGRPAIAPGTRALLGFGGAVALFALLGYVARNVHGVLVGRLWGVAEAGLYSRAVATSDLLLGNAVQPVGQVTPAALSRLAGEPEKYREFYGRSAVIVTLLAIPITFVGVVLPHELVAVVLGARWDAVAPLLQALSLGAVAYALNHTTGWVYLSSGRSRGMLAWGCGAWTFIIAVTVASAPHGLRAMALASSAALVLLLPVNLLLAFRGTPLRIGALARRVAGPLAAGAVAGVGGWACTRALDADATPLARLVAGGLAFGAIDLALLLTVAGQGPLLRDVAATLRRGLRAPAAS